MIQPPRRLTAALMFATLSGFTPQAEAQAAASTTAQAAAAVPRWVPADATFMAGMIGHHAQAILMAGWAPSHGASPEVRVLAERIIVAQRDEIGLMQRWLREWGQPVPEADPSHHMMAGMEHGLMPGMLTADQLGELDRARGKEFDQLFLLFMIRHHQGAVAMVQQLMETSGAARGDAVFKLVSDMNADQSTEIRRMSAMLAGLPAEAISPQ